MGFIQRLFTRRNHETKGLTISTLNGLPATWTKPDSVPAHLNGVVMAATKFVGRAFPEAPLIVEQRQADTWEVAHEHPLVQLINKPNAFYGGNLLWSGVVTSLMTAGNAYVYKARTQSGKVGELTYLPHYAVSPKTDSTRSQIVGYDYRANGQSMTLAVEDVIHFRDGINPDNPLIGLSPLAAVARELRADQELAQYTHAILRNMGVVSVIITPKDAQAQFEDGHADLIKTKFQAVTTGENRGEPLVLDAPLDIQSPGWSPKDLDIASMAEPIEARLCSVLGIHPAVLNLSVGLKHSTFSNMREAREAAWEQCIIPMQALCADVLNNQLLPDFGDSRHERCRFDLSEVRALAEDENERAERLGKAYQYGGIKRSEYRAALGYESDQNDELYFTDIQFSGGKALSQAEVVKQLRERASERQAAYEALG